MRESVAKRNTYVRRLLAFAPIIMALVAQPVLVMQSPIASAATTAITLVDEHFDDYDGHDASEPGGWGMIGTEAYTSAANSGLAIPGVAFSNDNDRATVSYSLASNQVSKSLSFWMRNVSGAGSSLVVDQLIGSDIAKTTIESIATDQTEETKTIQLEPQTNGIKFTMQKLGGNIAFDDVVVTGDEAVPETPVLISPEDGAIENGGPTQTWQKGSDTDDVDHYVYQSYRDAELTQLIYETTVGGTSRTIGGSQNITFWWRVAAVSTTGNMSEWSDARKLTVDNIDPVLGVTNPNGDVEISLAVDSYIVDGTATDVNGVNRAVLYVTDSNGNRAYRVVTREFDGTAGAWEIEVPSGALTDGEYTFNVNAYDEAGNSTTVRRHVTVDSTAPDITITLPSKITIYSPGTIVVKGVIDETAAGPIVVILNGITQEVYANPAGNWIATFANVPPGQYDIAATAQDELGNSATAVTPNIIVKAVPASFIVTPVDPPELPSTANEVAQNQVANSQNVVVPTNAAVAVADTITQDENDTEVLAEETTAATESDVKSAETASADTTVEDALATRNYGGIAEYWWLIMVAIIVGATIFTVVRWRRSW